MERTTNLNLPQWEASDPIRRGDFNEAFAVIDAAGGGAEAVSISTSGMVAGDTVYTFAKPPKFVILRGVYVTFFVLQGGSAEAMDYYSYNDDYTVVFQLDGTALVMTERTETKAARSLTIVSFY